MLGTELQFIKGATYTRRDVQDALGVPEGARGGAWDTGYNSYNGALYVFCNVGASGRTGHDYGNEWRGGDLLWSAKTGAHADQPLMRRLIGRQLPAHVFWRSDNQNVGFTYQGEVTSLAVIQANPLRFQFKFDGSLPLASNSGAPSAARFSVRDILNRGGRLFAKSEFGPIHSGWPAVAFSSQKIADDMAADFQRGRDFILFVGTTDPHRTEDPNHRSAVLSAVTVEPKAAISTKRIVAPEFWERSVSKWGVRWEWALPVEEAFDFSPFVDARAMIPLTYAKLGTLQAMGRCVLLDPEDVDRIADAGLTLKPLHRAPEAGCALSLNEPDPELRKVLSRIAMNIHARIETSEMEMLRRNPLRTGENLSDTLITVGEKWRERAGHCALCGTLMPLKPANRLFQPSPDRIDSAVKTYDPANLQLVHLGCNLAKNNATMEEWHEFFSMLRNAGGSEGSHK